MKKGGGIGMKDAEKTREQLTRELASLRRRIAALRVAETERQRAEDALRRHVHELQARNEEWDAFTGSVAPDLLRTLGVIVGFAEALEEDPASLSERDVRRYLRAIARRGRHMRAVVDDLVSQVLTREAEVDVEPLDMAGIVAQSLERLERTGDEFRPRVTLPESWPAALGYGPWVVAVWSSLLHIAVVSGDRPPRLELGGTRQEGGEVHFWIRSADAGRALAPTGQDQVREQVCRSELSVARRMVERMGGRVEVGRTSGSMLSFTLPGG
jgi:light-regulated signal transduction histidine kinase (bacteriophytochrome)